MQRTGRILIIVGVLLGVLAMVVVAVWIQSIQPPPPQPKVQVVVSQQTIPIYQPIVTGAVALQEYPADLVRPDTITDTALVIGKLSNTNIVPGQVIVRSMIVPDRLISETTAPPPDVAPSTTIPDDKVAVAFPISDLSGVAQALRNHDHIDLMVTYEQVVSTTQTANSTTNVIRRITQLTLQDIEIMRVGLWNANPEAGNANSGSTTGPTMLTLLVNQQDALVLKFLRETTAEVQFALRPAGNHRLAKTQPVVVEYIDQRFNFGGTLSGLK